MFPTWPAKSELGHKAVKKNASPKPPEGGQFNEKLVRISNKIFNNCYNCLNNIKIDLNYSKLLLFFKSISFYQGEDSGFQMNSATKGSAAKGMGFSLKF